MEGTAGFILIMMIYFMSSLAFVQNVIHPSYQLIPDKAVGKNKFSTNYSKIMLISLGIAFIFTAFIYILFM